MVKELRSIETKVSFRADNGNMSFATFHINLDASGELLLVGIDKDSGMRLADSVLTDNHITAAGLLVGIDLNAIITDGLRAKAAQERKDLQAQHDEVNQGFTQDSARLDSMAAALKPKPEEPVTEDSEG